MKDKIRKADEKTLDYIGDNLLEITIEELKNIGIFLPNSLYRICVIG